MIIWPPLRVGLRAFFVITALLFAGSIQARLTASPRSDPPPLAFPGAEGYGRFTTGGRGYPVYKVTNLNDSGSGSLREALSMGNRTIVFAVAGTIALESRLTIARPNITVAGHTAPGDGICLKNYGVFFSAENVIIRFLRFRLGNERPQGKEGDDALGAMRTRRVIVDHCSISWSTDEAASFYDNEDTTLQWCLISESLNRSVHGTGSHGMGGLWGGQRASFHHNLLAHHHSRNPRFVGSQNTNRADLEHLDFRNNVIYNWGGASGYGGEGGVYNIVNNFYRPGPATKANVRTRIFAPNAEAGGYGQAPGVWGKFYVHGNHMDGNSETTNDNWQGLYPQPPTKPKIDLRSDTEYFFSHVTTTSAQAALDYVLAYAGASVKRDSVDARIVQEVRAGTFTHQGSKGSTSGIIDSQADVGGWPELGAGSEPGFYLDSDNDGLPDAWEARHPRGPNLDPSRVDDADGYTNLEDYLNHRASLWTSREIGTRVQPGKVVRDLLTGHYALDSGGTGIGGERDSFHGYLQPMFGLGSLSVRLNQIGPRAGVQAGIMVRADTGSAEAAFVFVGVTSDGKLLLSSRSTRGAKAETFGGAPVDFPCWLRLERIAGGQVRAFHAKSPDAWQPIGRLLRIALGPAWEAGLAATANSQTETNPSTFDNVEVRMYPESAP